MRHGRLARSSALFPILLLASGCSVVPRSQLDDCAQRCRALQAETAQLKDETIGLRSQNRDLAQRGVEDSKRLRMLEEANHRLEENIVAYQKDRDDMAASFDQLRVQMRASADRDASAATASRTGP